MTLLPYQLEKQFLSQQFTYLCTCALQLLFKDCECGNTWDLAAIFKTEKTERHKTYK